MRSLKLHVHLRLKILQSIKIVGLKLNEDGAVKKRLLVFTEIAKHVDNILKVLIGLDRLVYIVTCRLHCILTSRILNDLSLFHRFNEPIKKPECYSGFV